MKTFSRMLLTTALAMLLLSALVLPARAATALVIDTFDAGTSLRIFGPPAGPKTVTGIDDGVDVLGGERDKVLSRTSPNSGSVSENFNLTFVSAMAYASGLSTSGSALVTYDGNDDDAAGLNPTGLGGVDLTSSYAWAFRMRAASDLGATATVTVYTDATSCSSASIAVPADPTYAFADFVVPFSTLTTASGCAAPADLTNVGAITLFIDGSTRAVDVAIDILETVASPGTGTPGYWKNHPEAWPVASITIGGNTYTKEQAIAYMNGGDKDKTYTLFRALVSAKLNVLIENNPGCVGDTMAAADAWMAQYPVGSQIKAGGANSPWRAGEPLYTTLDRYNNGLLCAPHRD